MNKTEKHLQKLLKDRAAVVESIKKLEQESEALDVGSNGDLLAKLEINEALHANRRRVLAALDTRIEQTRLDLQTEERKEQDRKTAAQRKVVEAKVGEVVKRTLALSDALEALHAEEVKMQALGGRVDFRRVPDDLRQGVNSAQQHWRNWHRDLVGLKPKPTPVEQAVAAAERQVETQQESVQALQDKKAAARKAARKKKMPFNEPVYDHGLFQARERLAVALRHLDRVKAS